MLRAEGRLRPNCGDVDVRLWAVCATKRCHHIYMASSSNPFDFDDDYDDDDADEQCGGDDDDGRFDDAEDDDDPVDVWARGPQAIAQLMAEDPSTRPSRRPDMLADLAAAADDDSLKMLPFLRGANENEDKGGFYEHSVGDDAAAVRIAEWPLAVGCASVSGEPAWGWRVWDAAKTLARELEGRQLSGGSVVELGAGSGLGSLVAARLGATAVVCTDLPRALPLLAHNVQLNGGVQLGSGDKEARATGGESATTTAVPVLCPGQHELREAAAEHDDHVCNVCGLDDELDSAVHIGDAVFVCRKCDFDMCRRCHAEAAAGKWEELPGWLRIQCEGAATHGQRASEWRLPSPPVPEQCALVEGPLLLLRPWDLIATSAAEGVSGVLGALEARAAPPPSLVLCADVTCSAALVEPVVAALAALLRAGAPSAEALLVHEKREAAVDAALLSALDMAGLKHEKLPQAAEGKLWLMVVSE